MTEQLNTQNFGSSSVGDTNTSSVVQPSAPVQQEKLVPQSTVDAVIKEAKRSAYEKGQREALEKYHTQAAPSYEQNTSFAQAASAPIEQHVESLVESKLQQRLSKMEEEARQKALNEQVIQTANAFRAKLAAAANKYPGIDKAIETLGLANMTGLVEMSNAMDNTADIIGHLMDNPQNAAVLDYMSRVNPALAVQQMQNLSQSLKQNQQAAHQPYANPPLSQIQPSPTTGADNGSMTVSDLRKVSWLQP